MKVVKYLGYMFQIDREIQYSSSSGIYIQLKAIQGNVYPKRILRMIYKSPIVSAACVEPAESESSNKEFSSAK